jgi:hypothetical protein
MLKDYMLCCAHASLNVQDKYVCAADISRLASEISLSSLQSGFSTCQIKIELQIRSSKNEFRSKFK